MTTDGLTANGSVAHADDVAQDAATRAMRDRGIDNPQELLARSSPIMALGWCRWFDGQRNVGAGLLASKIASGEPPPTPRRSVADAQREYADQIVAWLRKHFPEFDRPIYGPHPAAVAEVIRLHHRHGKGQLTKREHGPAIRAAVKTWQEKWEQ